MKKSVLLALLAAGGMLTSCNLNNDVLEQSVSATVSQLIIPDDPMAKVNYRHNCTYTLNMDMTNNTLTIRSSDFTVLGKGGALTTESIKYVYSFNGAAESYTVINGTGKFGMTSEAKDINGFLTTMVTVGNDNPALVLGYRVNGATVRTFYPNMVFYGTTKTSYSMAGADKSYEATDAKYQVSFSEDMKKANVVIYNVRFAEEMKKPLEAVILKDLDVTLDKDGYKINGTDIIPDVKEGSGTTPYVNYPFRSISLKSSNADLTQITCEYVVSVAMGPTSMDFSGEFTGIYADYIHAQN